MLMIDTKHSLSDRDDKGLNAPGPYLLDTLPEKEYDAITRLASYVCHAPIALITLVDGGQQWLKSKIGIDVDAMPGINIFCDKTLLQNEIFEVEDVLTDKNFKNTELARQTTQIRFYAGAPLIDADGNKLGTLCVIDTAPRTLTAEQRDGLTTLAHEVVSNLVLKKQQREMEQTMNTHQEFYNLFNSSPEIHLIAKADSTIEVINDAVTSILGFMPKQAIGRSLWEFVGGTKREQFVPLIEKALATGESFDLETETVTLDNEIKWIGWCGIYKGGKWYASGRDITEQKQISGDLKQLSLVASKISNGVAICDANDKVVWLNDAFETITGYNLTDIEGKSMPEVLKRTERSPGIEQYHEMLKQKDTNERELQIIRKDDTLLWVSITNTPLLDEHGDIQQYIRVVTDINTRVSYQHDFEIITFAARKSPSGILIRNNKSDVIWMNEALEKLLGYSLEEMKGQAFGTMLNGPDTDLEVFKNATAALKENKGYEIEIKLYKKDKTPVWLSVSNSPLLNSAGNVERQITSWLDISERKKTEEELKKLSLVASNSISGVIINDDKGKVEWVNSAFEKITGYSINDVKGRHLGDVIKGELTDVSIIEYAREQSKNKKSFEVDIMLYRKDGKPIWLSVINSVILNAKGKVEKYIEVIIDITSKKKVELELIAAKEEALQLSRAKDMFISVMSHEIRTPLNAVIGMSHLLLEDNPMDYQKENLGVLKFSAQNLMALINEVLDFTKIETGNVELEKAEVDLHQLVNGITSSMQYKAAENGITLTNQIDKQVPAIIIGDQTRLSQILLNLVSNAVKFTSVGNVNIGLSVIKQNKQSVRIRFEIKDTGIGIANDKLNTIFDSFKQAEADTTRKYGGTGLGLAITKRLIELHDSRINVDSVKGEGSNFWFTITFDKSKNKKTNTGNVDSTLNINVLVVDDNQINRMLINKILSKWGATADFAENGVEAIEKVEGSQKYDVVLMDVHMPEMGGLEATQIIRAKDEPYFKQLPIIALTASMLNSQMDQIGDSGMNDYLLKPFEPQVLFDKLSRYQKQ